MREIRTSGSMSGDGKRDDARVATAPTLDSTENKGPVWKTCGRSWNLLENKDSYAHRAGMLCAPQRRGSPVGGSPTQIVVGKSGSRQAAWSGNGPGRSLVTKAT